MIIIYLEELSSASNHPAFGTFPLKGGDSYQT